MEKKNLYWKSKEESQSVAVKSVPFCRFPIP